MRNRARGVGRPGRPRAAGGDDHRVERDAIDRRPATGRGVERRVDVAVLRIGRRPVRLGLGEVADDGPAALRRHALGLLAVADERGDRVAAADERVEHGPADVARRAGQEDTHEVR